MPQPGRWWRGRDFRSLRLSVRTPPFHGGESGSIPLGSANNFNGLAHAPLSESNRWPINVCVHLGAIRFRIKLKIFSTKGIRAGVGALPVIGSSLTEFLAFVVGDPAQERRDDFMKTTLQRVVAP